jgi:hypothetical protein
MLHFAKHTSFNNHRIFCGANQAQSPHFLLNGKTLKSDKLRVVGINLKDKLFPDLETRGNTHNELSHQPPVIRDFFPSSP